MAQEQHEGFKMAKALNFLGECLPVALMIGAIVLMQWLDANDAFMPYLN